MINKYSALLLVFLTLMACQEDEPTLSALVVPTNLSISTVVDSDQSGNVTLTATADNALNIHVIFKQNAEPVVVSPGEPASFRYTQSGQYSQLITVVAYGAGGTATSKNIDVDLDVQLLIDPEILQKIAGDGTKSWVWNREVGGHWGAGSAYDASGIKLNADFNIDPNALNPCAYDDVLTFSYEGINYGYQLDTGVDNLTLVGWADEQYFFPNASPQQFVDVCRDISSPNATNVNKIDTNTSFLIFTEGELDNDNNPVYYLQIENSTLSFWNGSKTYRILILTEDLLRVRAEFQPILESDLVAYFHEFIPIE
ncbi:hypothetical protein OO009_10535 [Flavobacteriaceae bacterium KMM 6897]|nr:hypothetical protein [Flavobacteriaceae bacterium KMM 6897]